MGYIYLCIALISGAIKGFCGKKTSSLTSTFYHSVLANLIRMSFCIIIGFAVVCSEGNFNLLLPDADVLLIALISGISTAVFVVSWLVSVRQNTYMLMDVFLMLGVLVPLTLGQLLFNEAVRPVQWLGLGILFAATLIMCSYNNSIKTKLTFPQSNDRIHAYADVVELADTYDLGSYVVRHAGSSPVIRTKRKGEAFVSPFLLML